MNEQLTAEKEAKYTPTVVNLKAKEIAISHVNFDSCGEGTIISVALSTRSIVLYYLSRI